MKKKTVLWLSLAMMTLISGGAYANTAPTLPANASDTAKTAVEKAQVKHREHHAMHHKVKKAEEQKKQ